jgi:hypothetical protein
MATARKIRMGFMIAILALILRRRNYFSGFAG